MPKSISTFLWFQKDAEKAAKFYASVLPGAKLTEVRRSPGGGGPWKKGQPYAATFEFRGGSYICFNGGPDQKLNQAVSLFVECADQRELDTIWNKLVKGGRPIACGWLEDRFGLSWQVVPASLGKMLTAKDTKAAGRVMAAIMDMVKLDEAALKRAFKGK